MIKARRVLILIILVIAALCAGGWIYQWLDYTFRPERYALYSAPWYTGMLLCSVAAAVVVAMLACACLILTRCIRRR